MTSNVQKYNPFGTVPCPKPLLDHHRSRSRCSSRTGASLWIKFPQTVPRVQNFRGQIELRASTSRGSAARSCVWEPVEDEDVVLVADIGGTNCRFVLVDISGEASKPILSQTYPTKDYSTFPDALNAFAAQEEFRKHMPKSAAFAVAGPVVNNKCDMTNLAWTIDGDYLTQKHGIRVAVLNDFEANGYGVPTLGEDDVLVLHDVPVAPRAPKVVLGPGTGLGEAQLFWDASSGNYKVWPTEGAHATFGPRGWKQRALHAYVEGKLGHCELEYIACGPGLEMIYEFLSTDEDTHRPHITHHPCKSAPEITQAVLNGSDELALEAVDLFLTIIGAEAGYMGLRALATGGVYICGGILPRMMEQVENGALVTSFLHQESRFAQLLRTFPLYLVKDTGLGIRGTIAYATQLLKQARPATAGDAF